MPALFTLTGVVAPGSQRGRSLGFPTANLNVPAEGLADGIYLAYTFFNSERLASLLFIGSALTFGETVRKVEVYLLDTAGDWYGREVRVEALKKVRDNLKFASAEKLVAQIQRDEAEARAFFGGAESDS
ncbi:MAG: riboflavin kinase [Candidatus Veblenbacteria bacterium]|nr:riboflavin kinase [Candidatus Veblenbacteria bacterium]MDZ4230025.1 riboflavin kinase [Candidatus Veblenbacteria bacterium]